MRRNSKANQTEPHLRVYTNRAVLVFEDGTEIVFEEGSQSEQAQKRYKQICDHLEKGWLESLYDQLPNAVQDERLSISEEVRQCIDQIVSSVTSEVGRAVAGLTVLQLCIKCLEPQQSIRLHKGGRGSFSWREGVSMRRLDSQFITPFLRKHDLLKINRYGLFMTRSLAENYPYTQFYKASIRGAKQAWLHLIDFVEAGKVDSCNALKYLLACLRNRADRFKYLADEAIQVTTQILQPAADQEATQSLISQHISMSSYPARLLEVAMHSFLQVLQARQVLTGRLQPLCQMRTANKKHRNVGDIEIVNDYGSVIEAWDSKYGKRYLHDELFELWEKLQGKSVQLAGFVVDEPPDIRPETKQLMQEIMEETESEIKILTLDEWIHFQIGRAGLQEQTEQVVFEWILAYVECLCQRRRDMAPIDEPADQWVQDWIYLAKNRLATDEA